MKQIRLLMLGLFAISLIVSCNKEVDESFVLAEYLESADSPINAESIAAYITASNLNSEMLSGGNPYIIDIRSADDFSSIGHIDGAVNVAAGDVIAHLEGMDVSGYDKVVVACYTGQTAGFVTSLVRMAGYDAYSLKWGMSSWNQACAGSLNSNSKNTYATQLETTDNPKGESGSMPVLTTGAEMAEDILDARVAAVLAEGFGEAAITAEQVFANAEDYYIVNYWPVDHYNLGHVPGAIQYTPNEDLMTDTFLKTLPADKTVVVYCYTGQTSAFMAAYLKVLGYDAKSLKFGMNGMATEWAAGNGLAHWSAAQIAGNALTN